MSFARAILATLLLFATMVSADVYLILPNQSPAFVGAAETIVAKVQGSGAKTKKIHTLQLNEIETLPWKDSDLIISLGPKAAAALMLRSPVNPIIYSYVEESYIRALRATPQRGVEMGAWSAIVVNQPLQRMASIADALLEGRYKNRILLLHSKDNTLIPEQQQQLSALKHAQLESLSLSSAQSLSAQLDPLLYNAGLLLAPYDSDLWLGKRARWVLRQAYRYQVPIVAYTESFTKAGAMLAIYASRQALALETAAMASHWTQHNVLERGMFIYPSATLAVNDSIARALKYSPAQLKALPDSSVELKQAMGRQINVR